MQWKVNLIVEVVPTGKTNQWAQKQESEWVNEKDTTWLASTTPLLVLQSEPMRNQGKSEVAEPIWQVIGHVEGDPRTEGVSGST